MPEEREPLPSRGANREVPPGASVVSLRTATGPAGPGAARPLGSPDRFPPTGSTAIVESLNEVAQQVRRASVAQWGESRAVEIVGQHPSIVGLLARMRKVAAYEEPVVILGESGTGKEALAQALYLLGPRRGRPFVPVNCPQYQDGNLTVSELFGHRKGSFTGAVADRKGCFETGNGGVIFLDEIADLHMSAQVMLLRALALGEFQPLGADQPRSVNVRVVAATNRPLEELTVTQRFRDDLLFRLRYFMLRVPPLRERGEDWRLLLDHALCRLCAKYGARKRFSRASLNLLGSFSWPGNVRQVISVATAGYAFSEGDTIEPGDFEDQLDHGGQARADETPSLLEQLSADGRGFWQVVYEPYMRRDLNREQVRAFVKDALAKSGGNYQVLLRGLRLPAADYQRFMDFLRHHELKP